MPRKRKQQIKVNNNDSLEGLLQEVYNDACTQIQQAQNTINELTSGFIPDDIDDATKIAKEKTNAQKTKTDNIKIKLEVAKLQTDVIKHNGNLEEANESRTSSGAPSLDDFKEIRNMVKEAKKDDE